jgi:hypothetical protein
MSSPTPYRNPSWAGFEAEIPCFIPASSEEAETVSALLEEPGTLLVMSNAGEASGCYRFDGENGHAKFLKIVPTARFESLLRSEKIAQWLAERGIRAVSVESDPLPMDENRWLFVYPYIDAAPIGATHEDLSNLGRAIAALHGALASHPDRDEWEQTTRERLDILEEVRDSLASGALQAGPAPEKLREIARRSDLNLPKLDETSVPLHGDLNPNNVLKSLGDGLPVFLDFEDTVHGAYPPEFELGFVAERVVLMRVEDDEDARSLIHALLDSYVDAGGRIGDGKFRDMPKTLQSRHLDSFCLLAYNEWEGVSIFESEWRKFFTLFKLMDERTNVFA